MLTQKELETLLQDKDPAVRKWLDAYLNNPLYQFQARPDKPDLFDEQSSFLEDQFGGIAVVLGGNRSGKTITAAVKLARFLLNTPPPRPNTPFWVCGKTYDLASSVNWLEKLSLYIRPEYIRSYEWHVKAKNWPKSVTLKNHRNGNNWVIEFKSSEQDREKFQAASIGGFWCDEYLPTPTLMEIWMRCSDYDFKGNKLYTLTPLRYDDQLLDAFKNQEKYPLYRFYRLNSSLNHNLVEGFHAGLIENELEELRECRTVGSFAVFSGAVFKEFSNTLHVCEPFTIPDEWHHVRGLDFGYNHATCCLWVARNPHNGCYYVYHEYYAKGLTMGEHLEAIKAGPTWGRNAYWGPTYADCAGAQERAELTASGFPTSPAAKGANQVNLGVEYIRRQLRLSKVDGKPTLYIFNSCENLISEMRSYSWHPTLDRPNPVNNDACDALRYAIYSDHYGNCKEINPVLHQGIRSSTREAMTANYHRIGNQNGRPRI